MCASQVTQHTLIQCASSCHTQVNIFFTAAMIRAFRHGLVSRLVLCILCTNCTLHSNTDLLVWYSNTQNEFFPGVAIFSLHTLALPSSWNVNYEENQLNGKKVLNFSLYLYRFHKYVSCGLSTINFCNPGVHYETPHIYIHIYVHTYTHMYIHAYIHIHTHTHVCMYVHTFTHRS